MQREGKGKGKGGKRADIDRCRAITNLSISHIVIGVDGAKASGRSGALAPWVKSHLPFFLTTQYCCAPAETQRV